MFAGCFFFNMSDTKLVSFCCLYTVYMCYKGWQCDYKSIFQLCLCKKILIAISSAVRKYEVLNVLSFLAGLLKDRDLAYRTIAVYRSVISQAHDPIGSVALGELPIVSRFMKGVLRANLLRQDIAQLGMSRQY